jgi:galactokinase
MTTLPEIVTSEFTRRFGTPPKCVVRAPGRVNLIGEHTDYNGGFVLPMAINRAVWIALGPRDDQMVRLRSIDQNETLEFDLAALRKGPSSWGEYAKGVAWALSKEDYELRGWDGVSSSDVPVGAGLSSSAAFELAVARAFAAMSDFQWEVSKMALLCQKAENEWVGVNCGIMDQMISAAGKAGHAMLIDCRDLSMRAVPLSPESLVVILDTNTRRGLVDSAYNDRRAQCNAAAAFFGVPVLREVSRAQFLAKAGQLDETIMRRARHVITEIERTLEAAGTTGAVSPGRFGQLMNESHASLRDDFEVSNEQLDAIAEIARDTTGCFGARMTGAGFGGCAVALIARGAEKTFIEEVATNYTKRTKLTPRIYVSEAANGADVFR